VTNIQKILNNSDRYARDIQELAGYIKLLEKNLDVERAKNEKLKQSQANFDQLKENFRKYRDENPRSNRGAD
jgi:hypothetical protein